MTRAVATRDNHGMPFAGGGSPIRVSGLQVVSASTTETFIKHRVLTDRGPAVIVIKREVKTLFSDNAHLCTREAGGNVSTAQSATA
jgi:hypothetical protein